MSRAITATEFVADGITPIAAYKCATRVRPGPSFLFESAPGPRQSSRYSIIGFGALGELRVLDGEVLMRVGDERQNFGSNAVLIAARTLMRRLAPAVTPRAGAGRFFGAYGAAAFELSSYFERLPRLPRGDDSMPDLHLVVPETVAVFDHFTHHMTVLTLSGDGAARRDDRDLIAALSAASIEPLPLALDHGSAAALPSDSKRLPFLEAVESAKSAIVAGEAYQIVLSQRWTVASDADPLNAYRALRTINPSPYMFFLDLGWGKLFGSSPEALVRLDGRRASLRPLAGTRPRDPDSVKDRRIAAGLKRDPKERAEHVMLVDLGRNDLGKTCRPGSVRVTDLLSVEYYSHVMHLVSEIRGVLAPEADAFDLFAAAFPAGTVSGAPKIRATELIAELEGVRRGYYAGSVGYFGFDGSMDACITLRSALARDGKFRVSAGAGIVADSDAASEDRECRHKAQAVLEAIDATREKLKP